MIRKFGIPFLKNYLKQQLLCASAKALKICMYHLDPITCYVLIHFLNKRAFPDSLLIYTYFLLMFKLSFWTNVRWNVRFKPKRGCSTGSLNRLQNCLVVHGKGSHQTGLWPCWGCDLICPSLPSICYLSLLLLLKI